MRLLLSTAAALAFGCASYPPSRSIDSAVAGALMREFLLREPPIFIADPSWCASAALPTTKTMPSSQLSAPDAPQRYQKNVFVLCDLTENDGEAHARLERILYHGALKKFLIAESGQVDLEKHAGKWRVAAFHLTAIDYLPEPPRPQE